MIGFQMKKTPGIFISYSRKDREIATVLEKELKKRGLTVWRDVQSIEAGARWFGAIEDGIRGSRALVVLITPTSAGSAWVTYEYAFATGARIPVIGVRVGGAKIPRPIRGFQTVQYSSKAQTIAKKIDDGILAQSRSAVRQSAAAPTLVAKFQEVNGEVESIGGGRAPSLCVDLWVEQAPKQTQRVAFEIPDLGFDDREWTIARRKTKAAAMREFLTDDMNSWGDVEIWARGIGPGAGTWSTNSTLYKALSTYYRKRPVSPEIRRALKQIRRN
jgi:hypothetical protein